MDKVKGKFLLSLSDHKEVRRIFAGFKFHPVTLRYSVMRKTTARGAGLALSFDPEFLDLPIKRR